MSMKNETIWMLDDDDDYHDANNGNEERLVGLFVRHEQNYESVDWSSSTSTSSLMTTTITTSSPNEPRVTRYKLNSSLFAIAEPYFMRTERTSLLAYIDSLRADCDWQSNTKPPSLPAPTSSSSLTNEPNETNTITTNNNKGKKRKKMTKRVAYLEANLTTPAERIIVSRLLQRYLIESLHLPDGRFDERRLLEHMSTWDSDKSSNNEARSFVASLFNNRFESLNYRTKLFANPFDEIIRYRFGISTYLIPSRCSFAGVDIIEGIRALCSHLKMTSVSGGSDMVASLVDTTTPFMLVIDPAWEKNKSVKRKRTYETVSYEYLNRLCVCMKTLLDLVCSLREETSRKMAKKKNSPTNGGVSDVDNDDNDDNNKIESLCAIWTTKGDMDFVRDTMLPALGLRCSYVLKWHKVTTNGLPVKIHGGLEFLVIGERCKDIHDKSTVTSTTVRLSSTNQRNGVIVSVPSAIHSHKPPILSILRTLYRQSFKAYHHHQQQQRTRSNSFTSTNADDHRLFQYDLVPNEFIAPLQGVELFARSLTNGFHSIGYECIKLQNERLFVTENSCSATTAAIS